MRRAPLLRTLAALAAAGWLAAPAPAAARSAAESMPVPVSLQVPLILKILTYDRNLESRAQGGGELRIGIVVAPRDPASLRARDEVTGVFDALADKTVKRLRLRAMVLEYASATQMEGALRSAGVSVMYVAPGNGPNVEELARLARAQHIVTTTGVPEYVPQGIAVGIGVQQDRPQILINLPASRSAGSEFDASLLRIVKIVR
jgi:hypothetical protein